MCRHLCKTSFTSEIKDKKMQQKLPSNSNQTEQLNTDHTDKVAPAVRTMT